MRKLKILVLILSLILFCAICALTVNKYYRLNTSIYSNPYIFNELDHVIVTDEETDDLAIYSTDEYLITKHKLAIDISEVYNIKYLSTNTEVFMYISGQEDNCLYSMKLDNFKNLIEEVCSPKILDDVQYLNFNDYLFFYQEEAKLNLIRIKDNVRYDYVFDTNETTITNLDNYGYSFFVDEQKFCLDGSNYEEGCMEAKYGDSDYEGKYKIINNVVKTYNNISQNYFENSINLVEYEYFYNIYIDKDDNLYFLTTKKDSDLQLVPSIVMASPEEEFKFKLNEIETSYTRSKQTVSNTLYFSEFYLCLSGVNSDEHVTISECYYPITGEVVYSLSTIDINYFGLSSITTFIFNSIYRVIIVLGLVLVMMIIGLRLIFKKL